MLHYSLLACTVQGAVLTGCPGKPAGAIPGKLLEIQTKGSQLRATQPKTLGVGPATWWGVPRMWGRVGIVCVFGGRPEVAIRRTALHLILAVAVI